MSLRHIIKGCFDTRETNLRDKSSPFWAYTIKPNQAFVTYPIYFLLALCSQGPKSFRTTNPSFYTQRHRPVGQKQAEEWQRL